MRPASALASALALAALPAFAANPPGVSHFTLPNGLETVVIEDHRAPAVVQMLWYRIGAADEQPGKSGIAHFLEHLMFKGTDAVPAGELSKIVARNGGTDNAFTSYDFTTYFQRIAADRLELVMKMEADRMHNLKLSPDDWRTERDVVLQERAQRTDSDPAALLAEQRQAAQYLNHPYGHPVIGWKHEVSALTRDDALAWYRAHYAPNDAVLVIAGDVRPDEVQALAAKYYGPIAAVPEATRAARPQEPEQRAPRRLEMTDPRVPQPTMIRTILAPQRKAGDQKQAAALVVLADLLAGSPQTSVLGRDLVLGGTALSVRAGYDGLAVDPVTFGLSMVPVPGISPEEAEAKFDEALARFAEAGPDPAQLDRVRTAIRAHQIYDRDSARRRAYEYGQGLAVGLTVEDMNDWPDLLAAVSADEVRDAARALIASPATVTGWLLPGPAAQSTPTGADPLPPPVAQAAERAPDQPDAAPAAAPDTVPDAAPPEAPPIESVPVTEEAAP